MGMLHKVEDVLKGEWDIHNAGDLVMCLGDFMDTVVGILMDTMGFMGGMV